MYTWIFSSKLCFQWRVFPLSLVSCCDSPPLIPSLPPDLTNPATFRDLTKPIGALNTERLTFFKVHKVVITHGDLIPVTIVETEMYTFVCTCTCNTLHKIVQVSESWPCNMTLTHAPNSTIKSISTCKISEGCHKDLETVDHFEIT